MKLARAVAELKSFKPDLWVTNGESRELELFKNIMSRVAEPDRVLVTTGKLLQWHHQVMEGGPRVWFFTDGLFHALSVSLLICGAYLLWRTCSLHQILTDRQMHAAILVGAGGFNVVEGIIDHHLLQLHHVRPGPNYLSWDLLWLTVNALIMLWGLRLRAVNISE